MRSAAASALDELVELLVDEDAQRLERARRRMDLAGLARAPRGRRCRRARWWCAIGASSRAATMARATARECRSSPSWKMMSARSRSDGLRHHVGGARAVAAHAHVERAVEAEREAALGLVELHRRDAEIEHDAVDRVVAEFSRRPRSSAEKRSSTSGQPATAGFDQIGAVRDRALVAVDADHLRIRPPRGSRACSRRRRRCRRYRCRRRARSEIRAPARASTGI